MERATQAFAWRKSKMQGKTLGGETARTRSKRSFPLAITGVLLIVFERERIVFAIATFQN
jgi:hypothetical protein